MIRIFLLIFIITPFSSFADETMDTTGLFAESVYQMLLIADYHQTKKIYQDPVNYSEMNPIIRKNWNINGIRNYFITAGIAHAGISYVLPKSYRHKWQGVTFSLQASVVMHNVSIGLTF